MSFAFLPWYTGDYLRDTRHLTPQKHGIYLLLLAHCWDQKGPVPIDEQEAAGIANCRSADEIESLRYVLTRYFVRMDDGWYNKRMAEIVAEAELISEGRRKGGLEKARRQRDAVRHAQALLQHSTSTASPGTPNPNPNPIPTPKKTVEARASRFALDSLPDDWLSWCKTARPDLNPQETFYAFKDYWQAKPGAGGRKLDWHATWRNWCRNQRATPSWAKPQQSPDDVAAEALKLMEKRDAQKQSP